MLIQIVMWLYRSLSWAIDAYSILLLVYFLMSWIPGAYESKLGYYLSMICEPYVGFFRRFIPPIGFISLAGIAAYYSLFLIQRGLAAVFTIILRLLTGIILKV